MHCARSATAYRAHVEMGVAGRRVGWGSRRAALWCRQVDWTQSCSARGRAADTEVSRRWASNGPIYAFSHAECMRFERAVAVTLHGVDAVPPGVPKSVFVGQAALLQTDACVGQMQYFCVFALSLLGSVGVSNAC